MFVYFGRRYTSKVSWTVPRQVTCENCRTVYGYQITRRASGTGRSAYMLDNQGASRRAKEWALANLDAALQTAVDPMPCPTCGCFQAEMIRWMRSRMHRWAMPVGLSVALAGGWIAILLMLTLSLTGGEEAALGFAGALSVIGGMGLIFYTRHLRARLDPNADCAARAGWPQVGVFVVSRTGQNPTRDVPLASARTVSAKSILWHYSRNGQVAGPVADSALRAMAARGQLYPSDLVWHEDLPNWVKAGSIDGLFAAAPPARQAAQPLPLSYVAQPMQRGGGGGMWVPIIGGRRCRCDRRRHPAVCAAALQQCDAHDAGGYRSSALESPGCKPFRSESSSRESTRRREPAGCKSTGHKSTGGQCSGSLSRGDQSTHCQATAICHGSAGEPTSHGEPSGCQFPFGARASGSEPAVANRRWTRRLAVLAL